MSVRLSNNASSTLSAPITAAARSLTIQAGDAGLFPAITGAEWFPATLVNAAGDLEIVRVTARNGATLSVTRAQEGTVALNFSAGDKVEIRLTAAAVESKADSAHSHPIGEVTGLQTALDGKAAGAHSHPIGDVTGLQTALDGKAAGAHSHPISEVTGLQTALNGKAATAVTTALDGRIKSLEGGSLDSRYGRRFVSGELTLPAPGSTVSVAHGLGATPKHLGAVLVCKVAERGYAVGDVVEVNQTEFSSSNRPYNLHANSSIVALHPNAYGMSVAHKTSSAPGSGDNTVSSPNWTVILFAGL